MNYFGENVNTLLLVFRRLFSFDKITKDQFNTTCAGNSSTKDEEVDYADVQSCRN